MMSRNRYIFAITIIEKINMQGNSIGKAVSNLYCTVNIGFERFLDWAEAFEQPRPHSHERSVDIKWHCTHKQARAPRLPVISKKYEQVGRKHRGCLEVSIRRPPQVKPFAR